MSSLIRDLAASTPDMIDVFGDAATVRAALRFEAALAGACAAEGLVSPEAARAVISACSEQPDLESLAREAAHAGVLAIPLVRWLRTTADAVSPGAGGAVHLGATSQDLADTAMVLQAREAAKLVDRDLARLADGLADLAETHAATPMIGRTLLQQALPVTFGLKATHWMMSVDGVRARLRREADSALMLQLGGPAGTLGGLAGKGEAVARRMATDLGLGCPLLPWHARREAIAGLASALAIVVGAVAKIALDVALLAQGEVGEVSVPRQGDRGGSSAMPHKRNPTGSQIALSAADRAPGLAASILAGMPQAHERGLGGWQAETPVLAELFLITHGAVVAVADLVDGLEVHTDVMRRTLDAAGLGQDIGESLDMVLRALAHREIR